ncbi:terpenoid synthase [Favolaschia claudopus]|uniref:Terpenoid synthase n=1 Tax=Favolaschia claudopus TaxID=2862362 RepID=A0AAW0BZH6_9AGAR
MPWNALFLRILNRHANFVKNCHGSYKASMSAPLDIPRIKQAVLDVLAVLKIDPLSLSPFEETSTLELFVVECIQEAQNRDYLLEPMRVEYIRIGAAVGHYVWLLPGRVGHQVAILASLLMGFYYCVDDCCYESRSLGEYGSRLMSRSSQIEGGLDHLTALNSELADLYNPVIGDLLRISHQAYMMGNYLEGQMSDTGSKWAVSKYAPGFPAVMKTLTSATIALYLLSFPPDAPFTNYLQTLPDGITIHMNTADIMSYYKEALDGEFNRVEQAAQYQGLSGPEMLGELVKSTAVCHERVIRLLSTSDSTGRLASCHEMAIAGFVIFQALHPRYKLRDFGIFAFE